MFKVLIENVKSDLAEQKKSMSEYEEHFSKIIKKNNSTDLALLKLKSMIGSNEELLQELILKQEKFELDMNNVERALESKRKADEKINYLTSSIDCNDSIKNEFENISKESEKIVLDTLFKYTYDDSKINEFSQRFGIDLDNNHVNFCM